ncbi:flagellar motor protein [Rothia sp. HMSC071C12]|uniref:flagellar motor protein n=1 Tax=Rothia sp. HMSC071C12 TaxID=1739446 RepID=UPI0008A617FB|nr:flagellar motor protein [Rothia sp. HMSC071C12]OFQ32842.1 flagellar motor protein [Rothia sp. HMSC071C12]
MHAMTHAPSAPTRQRWMFLAVLLTIAALILSACGAKIETQLGLESAEKGTRTMLVSFDMKDNKDKIKGGTQALDASVRKHLPEGLEYGGIQSEGDKARATFTIPFSSVDEYRTKVASILKAAGSSATPQISIVNSDQGLVQGIQVKENFSSKDLLDWLPEALVVDGVIETSNKNSVFNSSSSETTVKFGEKEVKNSGGSTISAKDVQDRGFKAVFMDINEKDGGYSVMVSFSAKEIMNSETSSAVDAYLNQVKPEGAELKKGLDSSEARGYAPSASTSAAKEEIGRTMLFQASSSQDLSDKLKKIFGASSTDLSFSREVTENDGSFKVEKTISGTLDCSLLCSPEGQGMTLTMKDSEDRRYEPNYSRRDRSSSSSNNRILAINLVSSRNISMKSMKVATSLGLDGSMEARFLYAFPTEDVAGAEQKLKDVFAGGSNDETEVRQDGDATIVSVKVRGKDQNEFNQRLNEYLPDSKVTVTRPGGYHPFGSDYTVTPEIKLSSKLGSYYSAPFEFTFKAPTFSSLDQQKVDAANSRANGAHVQLTVNGGELSVKTDHGVSTTSGLTVPVSGLSMTDVIVDAVIVGLLLLILVMLFLFRKKIAAARAKGRERRAASAAALGAAAGVATGYGATQADAQNGYQAQGGYAAQNGYAAQPGYQAQGGYPAQNTAYAAGDDSPTQVFTPQHGLNYGENEPTKAMPAYIPPTEQPAQPVQPGQTAQQPAQPNQPVQPVQPVQPNQFGADDGDVLQ